MTPHPSLLLLSLSATRQGTSQQSDVAAFDTTAPSLVLGTRAPFVTAEDPGEITLEWTTPLDAGGARITGYVVQSRQWFAANTSWSAPAIVYDGRHSTALTARVKALAASTTYAFSVTAFNYRSVCFADDVDVSSDELVLTTQDGTVPYEPKNVHAVNITGGAVTIAWNPPLSSGGEPVLAYIVYAGFADDEFFVIASVDVAEPRTLTLYQLQTTKQYKFAVCAENIHGLGRNSTTLFVTTTEPTPPGPPKNLQTFPSASGGTVILAWDAPDDSGGVTLQSYVVYRNDSLLVTLDAADGSIVFTDTNSVEANQVYSYAIVAANSMLSGTEQARLDIRSTLASVPQPPQVRIVETRGGSVAVEWTPSPDSGGIPIQGYKVVLTRSGVTVASYDGDQTQTVFRNLFADTEYRVSVQTRNAMGLSVTARVLTITDAAEVPARAPMPRLVDIFGGRIRVEVAAPDDFGGTLITQYAFFANSGEAVAVALSAAVYDIVGLVATTEYALTVCAVNSVGQGEKSDAIQVMTTSVSQPGVVDDLAVQATTFESLEITWTSPDDTGGAVPSSLEYDVLVENSSAGFTHTVANGTSPLLVDSLDASTTYTVRVRARNTADVGNWSAATIAETDALSPGTISFLTNSTTVSEAAGVVRVTVVRVNGGAIPATCYYRTTNGTALDRVHFQGTVSGVVHFDAGAKQQTLNVTIINNDVIDDPDKVFYIELLEMSADVGLVGGNTTLAVTIADDGDSGLIQFAQANYSVSESAGSLTLPIVRIKAFSGPTIVRVDAVDVMDSVIHGVDYTILDTSVAFADRQTSASVRVQIANDAVFQLRKVFGLTLTITSGRAHIGTTVPAYVEILDDGDVSRPMPPLNVKATALSGGWVLATWTAPENKGAANVTLLSYRVVVTSDLMPTRELVTFATALNITSLAAKATVVVSVAAKSSYFESFLSAPAITQLGSPTFPTAPTSLQMLWRTGGAANLSWVPPFDAGGADILFYRVVVTTADDSREIARNDTQATSFAVYELRSLTNYSVVVQAQNAEGLLGNRSLPVIITTRAASSPSKPPGVIVTQSTGGALYLNLPLPLDMGGLNVTRIVLSATSQQFPSVFNDVYDGASSSYVLRRLVYSTEYKLRYKVSNAVVRLLIGH